MRSIHQSASKASLALFTLALCTIPSVRLSAEASAPAAPTQADAPANANEAYHLFMGNDIALAQGADFYPIVNVAGDDAVIRIKNQSKIINRKDFGQFKLNYSLKLSHVAAAIDNLEINSTYTPSNDPSKQIVDSVAAGYAMEDASATQRDRDLRQIAAAKSSLTSAQNSGGGYAPAGASSQAIAQAEQSMANAEHSLSGRGSDNSNLVTNSIGNYDAVDVSFKITSPVRLERPYIVFIATYGLKEDKAGESHKFIYARDIEAIGIAPTTVSFTKGGLPLGFTITSTELHVYQNGKELATNLSDKRINLSRDKAIQYLRITHQADHKKADTQAKALFLPDPSAPKPKMQRTRLTETIYVHVDASGASTKVSGDAAGHTPVAADIQEALRDFVFLPAMKEGKPVAGVLQMRVIDHL